MVKLVLLYRHASKTGSFDLHYRANLALLKRMSGIQRLVEGEVIGGPAGESPFHRMVELHFEDFDTLDAAMTSPEGVAAGKDLMGFASGSVELMFVRIEDQARAPKPLTPKDLQAYLDENDISAEIIYPGTPTPTVTAAAEALDVAPDQIIKSVVFMVDGRPFLVFGCGNRRIDPRKLAERLNVGRKRVKLADPDQVLGVTGYRVGSVPPLGLKTSMPAYVDPTVIDHEVVYAGGGGVDALLKIKTADLLHASRAEVAPMLRDEPDEDAVADESEP
jgi:Cys-tRNA(Pro) deacylase